MIIRRVGHGDAGHQNAEATGGRDGGHKGPGLQGTRPQGF